MGWEPIVLTVEEDKASYPVWDESLRAEVEGIKVFKTQTREPLRLYSRLRSGSTQSGIPQGEVDTQSFIGKIAAFIRGNFFIPDARKGWVPFAINAATKVIAQEKISHLITTGPPHSTHLVGVALSPLFSLNWWADFRDPWTSIFYNKQLYRTSWAENKDAELEEKVLQSASGIITTLGGTLQENLSQKAPEQNFVSIPNGYDAELMNTLRGEKDTTHFHIVYTGLLTRNQAFPEFLRALQRVNGEKPLRFSLAGNIDNAIINEIKEALPRVEVKYHGYVSHPVALQLMKSGDLLLNFIFEGAQTEMISGKLLEYLATKVPVLSLGDPSSTAGKFIAQGSCAQMISPDNSAAIQEFIQNLLDPPIPSTNDFPEIMRWSREAITRRLIEEILTRK